SLLDKREGAGTVDRRVLAETGRRISEKCAEFGVEGEIAEYHPGPVVTTYEFRPAAGSKVNQAMGLSAGLALALPAASLRDDRLRQERRDQRSHHLDPVQGPAGRGQADPDRSQDGRARGLRGPSAPLDEDHHRPEEGGERLEVGGQRDGGAIPAALGPRTGPQRRAVQRGHPGPGGRGAGA